MLDEYRLPVLVLPARGGIHEQEAQTLQDDAARFFQAARQIGCADQSLEGVGQDGVLIAPAVGRLPLTQEDEVTQADSPGRRSEGLLRDGGRAHARQV